MEKRKEMGVTYEALRLREVAVNSFFAKRDDQLRVKAVEVDKNNVKLAGWQLSIRDLRAQMTIYPTADMLAKNDCAIANELAEQFNAHMDEMNALDKQAKAGFQPEHRDMFMDNVIVELLSATNREWLERVDRPYMPVMDMVACLRCPFDSIDDQVAYIPVTNHLLDALGLKVDEVFERGIENLTNDAVIHPMRRIIEEILDLHDEPVDGFSDNMYIVTNSNAAYGAGLMLSKSIQSELLDIFGRKGIMILPSSIHEFIAIPGDFMTLDEAREMVREINATEVAPEERLTDEVYLLTGTPEHPILAMYADLGLQKPSLIVAK